MGHAVDMEPEFREDVLVGYVGVRRSWWGMLVGVCWCEEALVGYVAVRRPWWGMLV